VPSIPAAPAAIAVARDVLPGTPTPAVALLRSFSLSDLDRPLVWLWVGMSAALCIVLLVAAWRLARLRREWLRASLEGRAVLVSDDVGPAVASFWSRDLVFPLWTLNLDDRQRRLMLAHEEAHILARDPWLRQAAGFVAAAAVTLVLACEAPRPEQPQLPAAGPTRAGRASDGLGSGWVTGSGTVHVGAASPTVEEIRRVVLQTYGAELQRYAGTATDLWFIVDEQGRVVSHGAGPASSPDSIDTDEAGRLVPRYDTLRAAMITLLGPHDLGPQSPAVMWVQLRAPGSSARNIEDRIDAGMAALLGPDIRAGLQQYYPSLVGQTSGPALDVWLGHDAQGRVIRAAQAASSGRRMDSDQIRGALAEFRPGNDAWEVVDRAALRGVVRDNVRVVWVYTTSSAFNPSTELLRAAAARWEPTAFTNPRPLEAIALVFDTRDSVVAHATGIAARVRRPCSDVLSELLPQFGAKFGSWGCTMSSTSQAAIYWGSLRPVP
jgi:hypothetical protein